MKFLIVTQLCLHVYLERSHWPSLPIFDCFTDRESIYLSIKSINLMRVELTHDFPNHLHTVFRKWHNPPLHTPHVMCSLHSRLIEQELCYKSNELSSTILKKYIYLNYWELNKAAIRKGRRIPRIWKTFLYCLTFTWHQK